jgi:hypothetical protein
LTVTGAVSASSTVPVSPRHLAADVVAVGDVDRHLEVDEHAVRHLGQHQQWVLQLLAAAARARDEHYVQLPLQKGDAASFDPALFHGAGTNRTADVRRMANLLQVSSAFGRAMEAVDRTSICRALYPVLGAEKTAGADERTLRNMIAASAEGYAFRTNLHRDQPIGGLAPETQAELVWRALQAGWPPDDLDAGLSAQAERHTSAS